MNVFVPLVIGFAFGWLLQKSGLSRYDRIVGVFRFSDLSVLQFLLAALATAAVGLRALDALGFAATFPVPPTFVAGNFVGGVVFGAGMALAGFCPGTVAAGAGEGRLDSLVAGGLGLFAGAVVYGLAYDRVMPVLAHGAANRSITLAELLHVDPWLLAVVFAELVVVGFYLLERSLRGRRVEHARAHHAHDGPDGFARRGV